MNGELEMAKSLFGDRLNQRTIEASSKLRVGFGSPPDPHCEDLKDQIIVATHNISCDQKSLCYVDRIKNSNDLWP